MEEEAHAQAEAQEEEDEGQVQVDQPKIHHQSAKTTPKNEDQAFFCSISVFGSKFQP